MLYDFTSFESDFTCLEVRVWVTFDGTQNKVLISNFHFCLRWGTIAGAFVCFDRSLCAQTHTRHYKSSVLKTCVKKETLWKLSISDHSILVLFVVNHINHKYTTIAINELFLNSAFEAKWVSCFAHCGVWHCGNFFPLDIKTGSACGLLKVTLQSLSL